MKKTFSGNVMAVFLFLMLAGLVLVSQGMVFETSPAFADSDSEKKVECADADKTDDSSGTKPKIISRKAWEANEPVMEMKKHEITKITIHHTGVRQNPNIKLEQKLRNLQAFSQRDDVLASGHKKKAWADVPYHYYICLEGRIGEARCIKFAGDTNTAYDPAGHALVVLEGSFGAEEPNEKQMKSLMKMLVWLAEKYSVPAEQVKGHNDYAATACPGANLIKKLPEIRDKLAELTKAKAPTKPEKECKD